MATSRGEQETSRQLSGSRRVANESPLAHPPRSANTPHASMGAPLACARLSANTRVNLVTALPLPSNRHPSNHLTWWSAARFGTLRVATTNSEK